MVFRLPMQNDGQLKNEFLSLDHANSETIDSFNGHVVYKCALINYDGIGVWTGNDSGTEIYSYAAAKNVVIGNVNYLEVVRIWTDTTKRRQQLAKNILKVLLTIGPVISDREGMTDAAYQLFQNIDDSILEWYDSCENRVVDEKEIQDDLKFCYWDNCHRYLLVLSNDNKLE